MHELVVRCDFRGVVTTNYDPGIVDARMRVRPNACSTSFASWTDELALDRWRSGDVFRNGDELPVLFAHGHHNQPDAVVLATAQYRRAYRGKLARALRALMTGGRLVWIGFSFADQRIAAILRELADESGTWADPGMAPRHVALMPWDPQTAGRTRPLDPRVLHEICAAQYGSDVVLYPARGADHSRLAMLLERFTDSRYPPVGIGALEAKRVAVGDAGKRTEPAGKVVRWVHGGDAIEHFAGRANQLARLHRWAADPAVRLIGVTALGGAGKTALVTEWLARQGGADSRPLVRGVFAWSFYEDPSEEAWALALLDWAQETMGIVGPDGPLSGRVLSIVTQVGLLLVLDGLEVVQESQNGAHFGRLLGGLLRDEPGWV